jgi:hypothetical protein
MKSQGIALKAKMALRLNLPEVTFFQAQAIFCTASLIFLDQLRTQNRIGQVNGHDQPNQGLH